MRKYRKISMKSELVDAVEKIINERLEYGYRSIAGFVEDATRRRLEELRAYRNDSDVIP